MADFVINDALTGDLIEFNYQSGDAIIERGESVPAEGSCDTLFFPGCSFINYAMPLVAATYDLLREAGEADGISVLCCGKILSYEPDGQIIRDSFEEELREHVAAVGIKRMICACPNCVKALREAFANDERTRNVELAVLPQVLADLGYRLDKATCARLIQGDEAADVLLCTHDSCPDRGYGDFARGLRAIIPEGLWVDPAHSGKRSICCGSLPRAAGKFEQADKCARTNGEEALAVQADAIVTACMSCTFQLNMAQPFVQCVNYLELLFGWRVDWSTVGAWMKLRFLFGDTLGAVEREQSQRSFAGLTGVHGDAAAGEETIADEVAGEREAEAAITEAEEEAAQDVRLSNANVKTLGE